MQFVSISLTCMYVMHDLLGYELDYSSDNWMDRRRLLKGELRVTITCKIEIR
jgi:hypothetical protein